MKIVFFGNSEFSVVPFQRIINDFDTVGLVTAPDTVVGRGQKHHRHNPVKDLALQYHIPIMQPAKLKINEEFRNELFKLNADLYVVVSYGKMLPHDIIEYPKYKTINLHASLLPKLRGAAPIQYALWQGLRQTGNTVQFITEGMDEGDIIAQSQVIIDTHDDYLSLEHKLAIDGADLLSQAIQDIQNHRIINTPQNHDLATYTKLITKSDGAVYFSMSAEDIFNSFRAFKNRPNIYVPLSIGTIKILDCALSDYQHTKQEGEILDLTDEGMIVSCYEGTILLKILQAPTKKALHAKDFANGNRLKKGSVLK